jgi:hypothetical protein
MPKAISIPADRSPAFVSPQPEKKSKTSMGFLKLGDGLWFLYKNSCWATEKREQNFNAFPK